MCEFSFLEILGLLFILLIVFYIIALFLGKKRMAKIGANLYIGTDLTQSSKKLVREIKSTEQVQAETITEFLVNIFKRITAYGFIAILVAMIPYILLIWQNKLIKGQNDLIRNEVKLMDLQNQKMEIQNSLVDSDRKSSLVFLMSNILDRIDDTTSDKITSSKKNSKTRLSQPLIARIVALSKSLTPYKIMRGDSLSELFSPERSQFFIAVSLSQLDNFTMESILNKGNFSYSHLDNINFGSSYFPYLKISNSNMVEVEFSGCDLRGANFEKSNLDRLYLDKTILKGSVFNESSISNTDLAGTDLTSASLKSTTLYKINVMNSSLEGAVFDNSKVLHSRFSNSNLTSVSMKNAFVRNSIFDESIFDGVDFSSADIEGNSFKGSRFYFTNFQNANITNSDFSNSKFILVEGLTIDQLLTTKSLYGAEVSNDSTLLKRVKELKPCLFNENGC